MCLAGFLPINCHLRWAHKIMLIVFDYLDFQKSPLSCLFITCRTMDFLYLIGVNFSDPKNNSLHFNQSEFSLISLLTELSNSIWSIAKFYVAFLLVLDGASGSVWNRSVCFCPSWFGAENRLTYELAPYAFDCLNGEYSNAVIEKEDQDRGVQSLIKLTQD